MIILTTTYVCIRHSFIRAEHYSYLHIGDGPLGSWEVVEVIR